MLTQSGVEEIKSQLGKNPILDISFEKAKEIADRAVNAPVEVPQPLDVGGGYSHEKHKSNYTEMYNAGVVYQITGEKKYAEYIRKMLIDYAKMYPTLPIHPAAFTNTPGRMFYQVLNEAVWLTFAANAYDCVYDYISAKERAFIEKDLFYPIVEFIENGNEANQRYFNSMHNFGTWMTAGAGMIGYVIDDADMVERALKGSKKDGETGFIHQLDMLFSPDGYYDEGPGYQRYAIYPFVTFAACIENNQPELKIFEYRDEILPKVVNTLLQCTYDGDVFLMNDAIAKDIHTYEILFSTSIAYQIDPTDKGMLGMIEQQNVVTLSDAGAMAAAAIKNGESKPFEFQSELIHVGVDGKDGGLGIIRGCDNSSCLTLKATTHGGGHGHFDRLSIMYFSNGKTIIPDYGSARFINVVAKARGGYAPENHSFSKLSIAHNTVTVDSTIHFRGVARDALKKSAILNFNDFSDKKFQIVSASENNAYKGVSMNRAVAMVKSEAFDFPIVLDIFRLRSEDKHYYDLPYYYNGHFMSANYEYAHNSKSLVPMGRRNGYQHLWREAMASPEEDFMQVCWLEDNRFYTLSTTTSNPTDACFVKTGANDPNYNLVTRNGVIYRNRDAVGNHTIVSIVEPHGNYDLVTETTKNSESLIEDVSILHDDENYTVVEITTKKGEKLVAAVVNSGFDAESKHAIEVDSKSYKWSGNWALFEN